MVSSRVRFPLQNSLTIIWISLLMVSTKVYPTFSQNYLPHICHMLYISYMPYAPKEPWNIPCINYISFQFKHISICLNLELSSQWNTYSENLLFNSFGVKVSQFNQHIKILELHITHIGIILNFYAKTGISFFLEGRMMLTIINLMKIFTEVGNVEVVYFLHL